MVGGSEMNVDLLCRRRVELVQGDTERREKKQDEMSGKVGWETERDMKRLSGQVLDE